MKKFATLMLALVMLISCAAIGMAEDITLDVIICQYGTQTNDWFTGTGMNGTSFVKKFEEANPGIKLNLEVVSWNDVYTVVSTRISNNNAPDILNLDSFADYANEGLLLPVKDYCPEELFNDFFPSFIAQSVIDDTVWAVPDLASARALYYNVDLLEAAGVEVPTTWAELEDVCQALVDFYGGDTIYAKIVDFATKTPSNITGAFYYDARDAVGTALSNIIQTGADMDSELQTAQETVEFNMGN